MVIGERLVSEGVITREQLQKALEYKQKYPQFKILEILYEMRAISKDTFLKELSKDFGNIPYVNEINNIRIMTIKLVHNPIFLTF